MTNNNEYRRTSDIERDINGRWWKVNIALWFLVGLFLLYSRLPAGNDLMRNIIVGGLIFLLITFLGIEIPKVAKASVTRALSQMKNSLIEDIKVELEGTVKEIAKLRKESETRIIEIIAGGPIVQSLTKKMKEIGHQDLEVYRFLGLKGEKENPGRFHSSTFQDFDIKGDNQNAVHFFWANTATVPSSKINAQVKPNNQFLTISFETFTTGGANIAIRPAGDTARFRQNRMRYLCFDMRLRKEVEDDSDDVEVGFRIVNGLLQHWEYSTMQREGYIKILLKQFGMWSVEDKANNWETFHLDIEDPNNWHLFISDGNYCYGSDSADFTIISSFIIEVGCRMEGTRQAQALALKPGTGKGKFDLKNIRLSETPHGHSI